jgi:hypothetical protein
MPHRRRSCGLLGLREGDHDRIRERNTTTTTLHRLDALTPPPGRAALDTAATAGSKRERREFIVARRR